MSWSSFRLSFGRFRRNTRAKAGSPDRASSINAEQIAAASGPETSLKTPCATNSATRSSLRSEEHTSELQSLTNLVCRLLLEKKKKQNKTHENLRHIFITGAFTHIL